MRPVVETAETKGNAMSTEPDHIYEEVRDYYAQAAKAASSGASCCGPEPSLWGVANYDHLGELPDAEMQVIDNASHMPFYENPGAYYPALLDFLSRHRGARSPSSPARRPPPTSSSTASRACTARACSTCSS